MSQRLFTEAESVAAIAMLVERSIADIKSGKVSEAEARLARLLEVLENRMVKLV